MVQEDKVSSSGGTVIDIKPSCSSASSRLSAGKPITLHSSTKPVGLSLVDNDSLKTPTLRTPTILGSPTKGPLSAVSHGDELLTPRLSFSAFSNQAGHAQAFFGDHEPLLTGTLLGYFTTSVLKVNKHWTCRILIIIIFFVFMSS